VDIFLRDRIVLNWICPGTVRFLISWLIYVLISSPFSSADRWVRLHSKFQPSLERREGGVGGSDKLHVETGSCTAEDW
jgi:hypothetical protein